MRTFAVHHLQRDFVLVLFVDSHPFGTLSGSRSDDLSAVGREWIKPLAPSERLTFCEDRRLLAANKPGSRNGIERRRLRRAA